MERKGAIPVPVATNAVSPSGGRKMKSPKGPWNVMCAPSSRLQRWFDINPSSTRFKQRATCPFSDGGDAIEYARVISSPSGVVAFTESHCPATNPKRATPLTSSSRCLVKSESAAERSNRASKVLNWAITYLDDSKRLGDASRIVAGQLL